MKRRYDKVESKMRLAEEGEINMSAAEKAESKELYDELTAMSQEDIKNMIKAAHE